MKSKVWLTGMTYAGNEQHLKELIEPIKDEFDGLCWVFNREPKLSLTDFWDKGYNYLLELNCSHYSSVIVSPWVGRNDYTRNKILFEGPMKEGDWFLVIDTLERIHPEFVRWLKQLVQNNPTIDGVCLEGKRLFYKMSERLSFQGNPHEGLTGATNPINLSLEDLLEGWWENIRPKVRDEYHWVGAYMDYYFFPNTNHLLLGYEKHLDYVRERYEIRSALFNKLQELGVDLSPEAVKDYINENGVDELVEFFNQEKILNDWYWFVFRDDKTIQHKHDEKLIKKIERKNNGTNL